MSRSILIKSIDAERILTHAQANFPEEACGLIAGELSEDGAATIKKVYLLENIDHAEDHFTMDPREQLAAIKDMRAEGLAQLGNWHSHPVSPSRPSEEDIRLAYDSGATYMILSLMAEGHPVLNAYHIEQDKHLVEYEEISFSDAVTDASEASSTVAVSAPTPVAVNEYPEGWNLGGNYLPK